MPVQLIRSSFQFSFTIACEKRAVLTAVVVRAKDVKFRTSAWYRYVLSLCIIIIIRARLVLRGRAFYGRHVRACFWRFLQQYYPRASFEFLAKNIQQKYPTTLQFFLGSPRTSMFINRRACVGSRAIVYYTDATSIPT